MSRSKVSLLEAMTVYGQEIMERLLEEGVTINPKHLMLEDSCESLRMDHIRPAYKWILNVYETEYAEVVKVKTLLSDVLWKRYRAWGMFNDHREVVMLRKALNNLRAAVISRHRPDFYKRSKRAKQLKTKAGAKVKASSNPA